MTVVLTRDTVIVVLDESLSTDLALVTRRVVVTVVTLAHTRVTRAVAITLTPRVTRCPSPAQMALTRVVRVS